MHIHYPSLVLVPDTFLSPHFASDARASLLINSIEDEFEDVPIEPVKRKYWNETVGGSFDPRQDEHHSLMQYVQDSSLSPNSLWMTKKGPPPSYRLLPSLVIRHLRICAEAQTITTDITPSRLYAPFSSILRRNSTSGIPPDLSASGTPLWRELC